MGEPLDMSVGRRSIVFGLEPTLELQRLVRRLEVINGACGCRHWSADEKVEIVTEALEPGALVSEIARRHRLTLQQLLTWRCEARRPPGPVVRRATIDPASSRRSLKNYRRPSRRSRGAAERRRARSDEALRPLGWRSTAFFEEQSR
ncbi:transposase [Salinarimonas ramus]|uniref:Transposase n=1 Tax=Salinarimonas ramus TaxID=690164 RepID=A0A917V7R1_9HYPH|nr:transposase [Salinarimonas ramus]GGK47221.1 hypothetical protein GCM10011322_37840 [Salinarimonas ramus]